MPSWFICLKFNCSTRFVQECSFLILKIMRIKSFFSKTYHFLWRKHRWKTLAGLLVLGLWYALCLPRPLFDAPTCMVLEDRDGRLLGARIAADGQWRFPYQTEVPEKFVQAIVEFEDERFFWHPGVDLLAIGRALEQNIRNGEIVSGGSTITMQVIRLARKSPPRTLWQKVVEAIWATRLEVRFSKNEILAHYAAHAPFGGNVVGLEAASWRYFGKSPELLSWAEAATLAVLPNAPALIHPGRNRQALLEKRNRLLQRLHEKGLLDSTDLDLAKAEPLPDKPLALPRLAPHLLDRAYLEHISGKKAQRTRIRTTVDAQVQQSVNQILERHQSLLRNNDIHNAAALVLDVETGEAIAYAGNVLSAGATHQNQVDVIPAPRSTGSILKPFLYAAMLQEGQLVAQSKISDIPMQLSGYRPENFHEDYDGIVSAEQAIVRSLNVPLVRMLQDYGLEKFHYKLQQLGLSTINRPASYYGLPLVLGGAEATLWDLTGAYASMSRTLKHFYDFNGQYDPNDFRAATYLYQKADREESVLQNQAPVVNAAAIWLAFQAMQEVQRPNSEGQWQQFSSSRRIAWKTGTSFGFRDAWAIGVDSRYAVGIWVGNADGEGRPGLIGVEAAAPILFAIFNQLPAGGWFDPPYDEMQQLAVCQKSGYRAGEWCAVDTVWTPLAATRMELCPYHELLHLDASQQWQVTSQCADPAEMIHQPWFVLPPVEEHYYRTKNPSYQSPPPYRADCLDESQQQPMQFIYPKYFAKIYVPIDLDGEPSRTVFTVAHRNPAQTIYWHLDGEVLGSTQHFHQMELRPSPGRHTLTLVDADGHRLERGFEIVEKEK